MARNSGTGNGAPTPHRAEGWGVLSSVRYLYQVIQFTERKYPEHTTIEIYSDNSTLIQRLQDRQLYRRCYANTTLTRDWDIAEQVYETILLLHNCKVNYKWVRGHQDRRIPLVNLTVESQFNVHADRLARHHIHQATPSHLSPVVLPAARCQLQIGTKTCHHNYIQEIRIAASVPALQEYLAGKFKWRPRTTRDVDWRVFQLAVTRYKDTSIQLVKLLHDQLPTRAVQARWDKSKSPKCSKCATMDETLEHLMQCDQPISAKFRSTLHTNLTQVMTALAVPTTFSVTFIQALDDWLLGRPILQAHAIPTSIHGPPLKLPSDGAASSKACCLKLGIGSFSLNFQKTPSTKGHMPPKR